MGSYDSLAPIRFKSPSFVTATLDGKEGLLGSRFIEGGDAYVLAYNGGNSEIPPGYGCVLQSGAVNMTMTISAVTSADLVVGVVKHSTIPTASYGYLITKGFTEVEMGATSGSVASRGLLEIGANGVFVPVSNTTANGPVLGQALEAIVSSASGSAYISIF